MRHVQSTQNNKFTISLQYLKEIIKDEVDFLSADKRQRFFKVILSLFTQNNKFVISLEYLQKEMSDEVDFLNANKHESLLEIDAMILM